MLFDERDASDIFSIDWQDLVVVRPYGSDPYDRGEKLLFVGAPFELSDDDLGTLEASGRFGCIESRRNLDWGPSYRWGSHELPPLSVAVGYPHARGVAIRGKREHVSQ